MWHMARPEWDPKEVVVLAFAIHGTIAAFIFANDVPLSFNCLTAEYEVCWYSPWDLF